MNIGIDARLLERKMTGIGRSLLMYLKYFARHDSKNTYYLFTYNRIDLMPNYYINVPTIKPFIPQKLFSPIWYNIILPIYLRKYNIDLFFSINQIVPLIKTCSYICVLHDVIFKLKEDFVPFWYKMYLNFIASQSVKKSDIIITVSNYSKQDILKYYDIPEKKIRVVYQAASDHFKQLNLANSEITNLKKQFNISTYMVLYVGMIEKRKNIRTILAVADELLKQRIDVTVVLVGKIGYGGREILRDINKREKLNVRYLKYVDDETLVKLYNIANVFLFPSYYEGFGYPPLEAMQCGTPVVAARNTSLVEVVGDAGILREPTNIKVIVQDILQLINDKEYYAQYQKKGLEKAKMFDIEKSTLEIIKIFNSIKEQ